MVGGACEQQLDSVGGVRRLGGLGESRRPGRSMLPVEWERRVRGKVPFTEPRVGEVVGEMYSLES